MRNATLLRPESRNASPATIPQVDRPCPPYIFQPDDVDSASDIARLFNLRLRLGYYNAEAKAALLRRAKQPPHDELLVDFASSELKIALTAAGIPLALGNWTWHATANHEPLVTSGSW